MPYKMQQEPTLSTSEVSKRLGFIVSVTFLKQCGVSPLSEQHPGVFWRESDMPIICHAIAIYLGKLGSGIILPKEKMSQK